MVCVLIVCTSQTFAQWNNFITHFSKENYGSGSMTWRICSNGQNTFFANQKGMLFYDGYKWSRYTLKNESEVWSVAISEKKKRIYIGAWEEFGYYYPDKMGILHYKCLSDSLGGIYKTLGKASDFYESDEALFIRFDHHILKLSDNKTILIKSPFATYASVMENGLMYIATDMGIYVVAGNRLMYISESKPLCGKRISAMIPYLKGILIATENDGLFYYNGEHLTPFPTLADNILKSGWISSIDVYKDLIAVGTINNGCVVIDRKNDTFKVFDEGNGLQSNTVKTLLFSDYGNLWIGLDYGIDYITLQSPFTYLYSTPHSYGIGFTAELHNGMLYLGTSRGLYYTPYPVTFNAGRAEIRKVDIPSGNAWMLYEHNGELMCFHSKGIYTIVGDKSIRQTSLVGTWSCLPVIGHSDMLFVGLHEGVAIIQRTSSGWIEKGRIKGINHPCRWIAHEDEKHLKVFQHNEGTSVNYTLSSDLLTAIHYEKKLEKYNNATADEIGEIFEGDISQNVCKINERLYVIPYDKGFALFDQSKRRKPLSEIIIRKMYTLVTGGDSLIMNCVKTERRAVPEIDYCNNSLKIEYSVYNLLGLFHSTYQYRINNGKWSVPSTNNSILLNNLYEGKYTVEVKASNISGFSMTDRLSFVILPPWYRSWIAYIIYIFLLVVAIYWLRKVFMRYLEKKHRQALHENEEEIDRMQDEIERLEQDKREMEAKRKEMEMANLLMNVARKNEILLGIKEDILKIIKRMKIDTPKQSKVALTLVTNKISDNLEGDEVLKKFEEQYDLLNDRFMQKLSDLHPKLNSSERLMCAYLRMKLSTKEIAPLLNISVRGVETIRYRLRKKLNLPHDLNLLDYLDSLSAHSV